MPLTPLSADSHTRLWEHFNPIINKVNETETRVDSATNVTNAFKSFTLGNATFTASFTLKSAKNVAGIAGEVGSGTTLNAWNAILTGFDWSCRPIQNITVPCWDSQGNQVGRWLIGTDRTLNLYPTTAVAPYRLAFTWIV